MSETMIATHFILVPYCFFNWYSDGWSQLGLLGTTATNRPIVPAVGDYNDGGIGGMMIGKGN
jgi:hypothetical protein